MTGVVTDNTGAALPGTTVILSNRSNGLSFTQTTDKQGVYHFTNVPPTEGYAVLFQHSGFADTKVTGIALSVGKTRTQDAKLQAGKSEVVEVSAGNQVTLDTTDATVGNNIDVHLLNELPIQDRRNGITTLFRLQPGVDFSSGAVTGARIDQTEVTVDGLDVNDIAAGTTFAIVGTAPVDSVEQFSAAVAGLVPSVGTGSGGQFQLVTKSGTNSWHGNIHEYHRDTTTESNSWFNNLIGLRRTPLIQNQFGGNLGGPIMKDKAFFFFELDDSRIIQSQTAERTVPLANLTGSTPTLNYINNGAGCNNQSRINTTPTCISSLSAAQVQALDPAGTGFNANVLSFVKGRYPAPNDQSAGDGVNTAGYRFTYPTPDLSTTYVGRVDYNLTPHQRVFGRFTINRRNSTSSLPVFPSDPVTHPFIDRSYAYVVSHVWTIGSNKVNQFYYGDNISKFNFPNSYNPTGANAYSLTGLSAPYSGTNGQKRRVPIPVVRDDFNWQLGSHNVTFGGQFKFIKTNSNLINNFNFVSLGDTGAALSGGLGGANPSVRPSDIYTGTTATGDYDSLFASTLGVIGTISTNYNYDNTGKAVAAGTGGPRAYRFYETEAYVGDTWKMTPKLTVTYGVRYQYYSVPYEAHGEESVERTNTTSHEQTTLDNYVNARLKQTAAGNTSVTGLPIYSVVLGGKVNNGPSLYNPSYKDFAPRIGFAYAVGDNTVVHGSGGIVYDRTVINAINFLQDQISYLFSNSQTANFGKSTINASLATDPRVGSNLSYSSSLNPAPAPLSVPYTPFVDNANGDITGVAYQPWGLGDGDTNFIVDPTLKDPYSIALNLGIQQKFGSHMLVKLDYAGRLGRRLLADADAGQVLDVPDYTGKSTQTMAQAFAGLTTQTRACLAAGTSLSKCALTPQPWFEDVMAPYGSAYGYGNTTNFVNRLIGTQGPYGDIADALYTLGYYTQIYGLSGFLPTNMGIPSQFGSNTFLTNKGNSNYHALLLSVSQSKWHGLRYGFNYTWAHSIDNTSLTANGNALFSNTGMICDITRPRACRANSDFDVRHTITGDVTYDLPVGHGRTYMATSSRWVDEVIGGWAISALPSFRSGLMVTPYTTSYLASFDNADPAIFTGSKSDLKSSVNVNHASQTVYGFAGGAAGAAKVLSEFRGPIGLEYGNRNLIIGPKYFNLDAGLAKTFAIIPSKDLNLTFRADAFNALNRASFGTPAVNIINNASNFGQITGTSTGFRVAQFSLRLDF
ncbi:MAG: TonB-dependent receptor [Acidobacteriota bacterium]